MVVSIHYHTMVLQPVVSSKKDTEAKNKERAFSIWLHHCLYSTMFKVVSFLNNFLPMGDILIQVNVRDNEPFEKAMRRFRRKVEREGIRKDIKKNSFYLKPGEKRRLKQRLAEKRRRKAMRRAQRRR